MEQNGYIVTSTSILGSWSFDLWKSFNMATVRVFIDGGASPNPGPAASAWKDAHSGEQETRFLGEQTNNYAEYVALRMALNHYRWEKSLEILTDSQLIKEQMSGNYKVASHNLVPIFLECMQIVGGRKKLGYRTIITKIRSKDNAADALVSQVLESHAETSTEL